MFTSLAPLAEQRALGRARPPPAPPAAAAAVRDPDAAAGGGRRGRLRAARPRAAARRAARHRGALRARLGAAQARARMYRELDADARSKYSARRFAADYREADAEATVRKVTVSRIGQEQRRAGADGGRGADEAVRHAARPHGAAGDARGRARRRALAAVPAAARPAPRRARAAHDPRRARGAPRCSPPTATRSTTSRPPRRSPASRRRGATRAPASSAPTTTGSPAARAPMLLFGSAPDRRHQGAPRPLGARRRSGPRLQRAAAAALGDRLGGVAVMRPRDGSVLALAGLAVSAPQPPGSTFKIITLVGGAAERDRHAVEHAIRCAPSRRCRASSCATRATSRAAARSRRRSRTPATRSSRRSAPSSAPSGCSRAAERLRLQRDAARPGAKSEHDPAAKDLKDDLAVGAAAIGQDRDLATPLQMAAVGATIANRGVRPTPRIVAQRPGHPPARGHRARSPARCAR